MIHRNKPLSGRSVNASNVSCMCRDDDLRSNQIRQALKVLERPHTVLINAEAAMPRVMNTASDFLVALYHVG